MFIQSKFYTFESLRAFRNQIGSYSFVRWLRNRNVSFSMAYYVMFQRSPVRF
jgi:hypothetical protein